MAEKMALNQSQVLTAKRWMEDEAGMERASLSPAEYVAYRMKVSAAVAEATQPTLTSRNTLAQKILRTKPMPPSRQGRD